jgi:hypothetical protein
MNDITQKLKAELWRRFGSGDHPAEWDGNVYGGGKLSQRFWEYFKAVELLGLDKDSVVLDIGGGSPITKAGFFASLLSTAVKTVIVMDSNIAKDVAVSGNIEFIAKDGSYEEIKQLLIARPDITHIASISVFEHIAPSIREGMVAAINEEFKGHCFVSTFEYHAKHIFFEYQLTARTTSELFSSLNRYYLDEMVSSPVWCENAYKDIQRVRDKNPIMRLFQKYIYKAIYPSIEKISVPCWHPVAVRFIRQGDK